MMAFCEDDEMTTTDTSSDSTDHDTQATPAPAAKKAPGRPRTADQPLTPAQRQRLYKQRKQAQALQLQRTAGDVENAAVDGDTDKLATAPKAAMLAVLGQCLDVLESSDSDHHQWRRNVARRLLAELERRYQLNREDDETVGED